VPSRSEPFGIVLLEAWAEGTVALFSDVGGMADIARTSHGEFGLTRPDDLPAWVERIGAALRDPDSLRDEQGQVRERVAKHYTWRSLAEKIVSGYDRVRR
jgi:glycosyltransferase involved in cell wall biosynthesis